MSLVSGGPRHRHGPQARLGDGEWEGPMLAQVAGIALDDVAMASVVGALGLNEQR